MLKKILFCILTITSLITNIHAGDKPTTKAYPIGLRSAFRGMLGGTFVATILALPCLTKDALITPLSTLAGGLLGSFAGVVSTYCATPKFSPDPGTTWIQPQEDLKVQILNKKTSYIINRSARAGSFTGLAIGMLAFGCYYMDVTVEDLKNLIGLQ
jgi:hypothetical protein